MVEIRLCGGLEILRDGVPVADAPLAGKQGRLAFAYLVVHRSRAVSRDELAELVWADRLPESWPASLSALVSRVRRQLTEAGLDGVTALANVGDGYQLTLPDDALIDWEVALAALAAAEAALANSDASRALEESAAARRVASRGFLSDAGVWVDRQRALAQDVCVRAALVAAEAHLADGAAGRAVEAAREAVARDELREAGYRVLMRALAAAGERAQALRTWERCRVLLADELGVDPSPETEAVYLEILGAPADAPVSSAAPSLPSGVVTFLLTDIVESSALWENEPTAMAAALERHDALVGEVVAAAGGTLLKSKLEGDATVSVFARATAGALAAIALREAIAGEQWPAGAAPTVRMALHTGEAFERAGDYFGPALNRAARVRGLAGAGQILVSQAVAELVRDHLPDDTTLADLGHHELRGLSRGENVYALVATADAPVAAAAAIEQPPLPAPLATAGPFVGRGDELAALWSRWTSTTEDGGAHAMLVAGEPGVGKSRLAAECARLAHTDGGIVVYGRCDEELGAALQPFVEAIRGLTPALGRERLRRVRGISELGRLVPEIREQVPEAAGASSADPDTERQALFDAITELLVVASEDAPLLVVLDDLHWAGKTTLSLLRHLLRNAGAARLLLIGTYRDTELARTHPLAATIADLRRDRAADRVTLSGLDATEVAAYLAAVGNNDVALSRELAEVTSGNPFFLIEALRHVEESGGVWEPGSLPEGVREATGRRLSHLSDAANDALSVAAVAGTTFELSLVERVRGADLVEEISEAVRAGLVFEDPTALGTFRFAHALVRQVLLAELVTLKRLRLHQAIAELLESDGETTEARLADLAYHWFECASAGNAAKAVAACRRAAELALDRLAYEEAGDLYRMAIEAAEGIDENDEVAALHLAHCDVLVTAGDVPAARAAIEALRVAARDDSRLTAWHSTFAAELAVLAEPDALPQTVGSIAAAARTLREIGDVRGEAKAHYVHALALERLGQVGAAERALVAAIDAARTSGDQRLADAILAETPPVVVWGPIPVTRASGRCLDVVRVLRITSGAPAVEAVALRCQAILEALRGRFDAARRMIAAAHRKVDGLGLVLRRLETEVSAGFIEVIAGDASEAERVLRSAYGELRARSLDSEAALAAALLGRALLLLDRDDEAEVVAQEAESLAGADLHPAVYWRSVRALAALRRGDVALARLLADQAIALVAGTDALLLVVDARETLAQVLRAEGDVVGAAAQERLAAEAATVKGATVLAERPGVASPSVAGHFPEPMPAEFWSNAVWLVTQEFAREWLSGDWDAVARWAPASIEDRSSGARLTMQGADVLESMRWAFDLRAHHDFELLATRGDRLALCRTTVHGDRGGDEGPFEISYLTVAELDDSGKPVGAMFDREAFDEALAYLDERFVAQDARNGVSLLVDSFNARDWAAFIDAVAPDVRVLDRRPSRLIDASNRDDLLTVYQSVVDLAPNARLSVEHARAAWSSSGGAALASLRLLGTADDAPFEMAPVLVARLNAASQVTDFEYFDSSAEGLTSARSRYEEWCRPLHAERPEAPRENAATRSHDEFLAAWASQDWDRIVPYLPPESDDRRSGARLLLVGDEVHRMIRSIFDAGVEWTSELVATRGDRLALHRTMTLRRGERSFELPWLNVTEMDGSGRLVRVTGFDPDHFDEAYAYLEQRHAAWMPETRWGNAAWRKMIEFSDAWARRDWDGVTRASATATEDRTSGAHFRMDAATALQTLELIFDSGATWDAVLLATRGDRLALGRVTLAGTSGPDAGPYISEFLVAIEVDGAGDFVLAVVFDGDAVVAGHEYLDERFRDQLVVVGPSEGITHSFNTRNWTAFAEALREDIVLTDRRAPRLSTATGRDDVVAQYRASAEIAPDARMVRDHLAYEYLTDGTLATMVAMSLLGTLEGGEFDNSVIVVSRLDQDRRVVSIDLFEQDDYDDARALYDQLCRDDRLSPRANAAWRDVVEFTTAWRDRDWDRVVQHSAPRVEDRTDRAKLTLEHDIAFRSLRSIFDAGSTWGAQLVATRGELLSLHRSIIRGQTRHGGGAFEISTYMVIEVDDTGRQTEAVIFDPDALEEAVAELDARYRRLRNQPPDNLAVRVWAKVAHALRAKDWDAVVALHAPEFVAEDRRGFAQIKRAGVEFHRPVLDVDCASWQDDVVATRGDRLVLLRCTHTFRSGAVAESLVQSLWITEVDEDGLQTRGVIFDPDDLDAAFEELDALYVAEGGIDYSGFRRRAAAVDRDAFLRGFEPAAFIDDHRRGGWGRVSVERQVELLQATGEVADDFFVYVRHEMARSGAVAFIEHAHVGTRDGGGYELSHYVVFVVSPRGRIAHSDLFDLDDFDAARACFDAAVSEQSA